MFDDLYESMQVTLPYREAKTLIQEARKHMKEKLHNTQIGRADLRHQDVDLGLFILKDIKFITSIEVEYSENDKPHIDLETCLPTAPQYLTISLKYYRY